MTSKPYKATNVTKTAKRAAAEARVKETKPVNCSVVTKLVVELPMPEAMPEAMSVNVMDVDIV